MVVSVPGVAFVFLTAVLGQSTLPPLQLLSRTTVEIVLTVPPVSSVVLYQIYRNGTLVVSGPPAQFGPAANAGTSWTYTDQGLSVNTAYAYQLRAFTASGFLRTAVLLVRTMENTPRGVAAPIVVADSPRSATATWPIAVVPFSRVVNNTLYVRQLTNSTPSFRVACTGLDTLCEIQELIPGSDLETMLEVCTLAGCATSDITTTTIPEDVPTGLSNLTFSQDATNGTLIASWVPPTSPNGVVTYTLFAQGARGFGNMSCITGPSLSAQLNHTISAFDVLQANNLYPAIPAATSGGFSFNGNLSTMAVNNGPAFGVNFSVAVEFTQADGATGQFLFVKTNGQDVRYLALYIVSASSQMYFFYLPIGSTTTRCAISGDFSQNV